MNNERKYLKLNKIGYNENYILYSNGKVYSNLTKKYLEADNKNRFFLKTNKNEYATISLKTLYRKAFNKEFCIDNI